MFSTRPYLIRAFYEWINDNKCTPYLVINALKPNVSVPQEFIEDGKIVLNIAPQAVREFSITNHRVEFTAKFSGKPVQIYAPPSAIMAIYAHENGRGMVFSEEDEDEDFPPESPPKKGKPTLTVVK